MAKFCFVSFEIHPTVRGGVGVLLYNLAAELLVYGQEVILILDLPQEEFEQFNQVDRLTFPNSHNCRAYCVWELVGDMSVGRLNFHSEYELRAYQFHHVARKIDQLEKPQVIEFFDYTGSALYALSAKVVGLDYQETRLTVRLHGALQLIDQAQPGTPVSADRLMLYGLEGQALRLAESVLTPSKMLFEQAYRSNFDCLYGRVILARPPMLSWPQVNRRVEQPNGILFYGRLHGTKGIDLFVDAACAFLSDRANPRREFYLVGYDSNRPPVGGGSYQAYLEQKIPAEFRNAFQFTGQLSWSELSDLLGKMLFAVISSHFETFCYAAHELYEAGIPLIVNDIPGLASDFHHEENALVFNGTVSDLLRQMQRLSFDDQLRQKITCPYSLVQSDTETVYLTGSSDSWMQAVPSQSLPTLLLCLLADDPPLMDASLANIRPMLSDEIKLIVLKPQDGSLKTSRKSLPDENGIRPQDKPPLVVAWFLGKLYSFEDELGKPLIPTSVITQHAILVLKAGDNLDADFIPLARKILQSNLQINLVSSWKRRSRGKWSKIETYSIDANPDLALFLDVPIFSRAVLRTKPGDLLIDLFDPRCGRYAELAHIWRLLGDTKSGITIPQVLIEYRDVELPDLDSYELDYLINQATNRAHLPRLALVLLTLKGRGTRLKEHTWLEQSEPRLDRFFHSGLNTLRQSPLNTWLDKLPWAKRFVKQVLSGVRWAIFKLRYFRK